MEILFVHLTDIHFSLKTDFTKKAEPFVRAILSEMGKSQKLFFIISGDIANTGKLEEYEVANKFFSVTKTLLKGERPDLEINHIIVPGNHDCNFNYDNQLRVNALKNINYQTLGDDTSVTDLCLKTQNDFWKFYSNYQVIPPDCLYYTVKYQYEGISLNFHCFNTAWMSQINEEVGGIFFPVKKYNNIVKEENSINFGIWHHPYNWFNPNTNENNKVEFEKFTEDISSTHFFGHEHRQQFQVAINKDDNQTINLLSGEIFNEDKKPNKSAFQIVKFFLNKNNGDIKNYVWNQDFYELKKTNDIIFHKEYKRKFGLNNEFIKEVEELKLPLLIDGKKDIKLSDIFIFPDLESPHKDSEKLELYFTSLNLINNKENIIVIDGESQVGKTSLLSMYFFKFYEKNIYPILLSGKNLSEPNIEKILKRTFKEQYDQDANFELYRQIEKSKKILLIDDFQECKFNILTTKDLLEHCSDQFEKIIITFDSSNSVLSNLKLEAKNVHYYSIKPFGYKKRNDLIGKYYHLKVNPYTYNEQTAFVEIKSIFDSVQSILGERLMPAYPVFILSIIQALQYKPLNQDETSFGYCYLTLITYALIKAGVKNDQIDAFFNFLTEFAYYVVEKEVDEIHVNEVTRFYLDYSSKFLALSLEEIMKILKTAKIVTIKEEYCSFSYNYILYYLSAKKIADLIHLPKGKEIVTKLFSKIQDERNANILVFITHHSKDISFIEESLLNSMIVLDKSKPISLDRDDPFYDEIKAIAENLKNDIIDTNNTPIKERENHLVERDKIQDSRNNNETKITSSDELNDIIAPFTHSFRSIEIIGQIIKNRKGSLEIAKLKDLVTEIYTTGFRTVGYYSELLRSITHDLKEALDVSIGLGDNRNEIEKKVLTFLQIVSLKMCLSVFSKLTFCIGSKELREIYIDVAKNMNTPAAKLVTFSINSYYGSVSVSEIKALAEEFKDNIVAIRILKSRVRFYVYNRNLDYSTKQKLASALNMSVIQTKPKSNTK